MEIINYEFFNIILLHILKLINKFKKILKIKETMSFLLNYQKIFSFLLKI